MYRYLIKANILVLAFILLTCEKPTEVETTGEISGTVLESSTSQKMSNVTITTDPITSTQFTDSQGAFLIEGVEPGIYTVKATKEGYSDNTVTVNVVAGESVSADVQLSVLSPELSVSNNSINFGTSSTTQVVNVSNSGVGTLTWNAVWSANWLTIEPSSGSATSETDVLTLTVDRTGLGFGNYNETVTITSNVNSETIDILMTIPNPNAPQLSAFPLSLDFGETENQMSFNISNTGTGALTWNITDDKAWIGYSPNSGTTESEIDEVIVTINRIGLTEGTHTGTISVSSNGGNQNISVILTIPDRPSLSVIPSILDFDSVQTTLTFDVANVGTGELNWSVSGNQGWIETNPDSGNNFSTINVTVSRNDLNPGDYAGIITVSSNGGDDDVEILMNISQDRPPVAVVLQDPTNITDKSMYLSWTRSTEDDFSAYKLYRDTSPTVTENSTLVSTITDRFSNTETVTGLTSGVTYYFRVFVMDLAGQNSGSNIVSGTTLPQLGTWSLVTSLDDWLWSVDAINTNFAYAVGGSGSIYNWNGSNWQNEVSPATSNLNTVKIIDQNNIWAVGDEGVFHFDGVNWTQPSDAPVEILWGLEFTSSDSVWVGGEFGKIYFYNGTSWSLSDLDANTIMDFSFLDSKSGWALGGKGKVFHYNGAGWSLQHSLDFSNQFGRSLRVYSADDIWIGSAGGDLVHWDGTNWTTFDGIQYIYGIDGVSSNDIWFVGGLSGFWSIIYHWDGNQLISVSNPTDKALWSVKLISSTNGWAVGNNGVILRYR